MATMVFLILITIGPDATIFTERLAKYENMEMCFRDMVVLGTIEEQVNTNFINTGLICITTDAEEPYEQNH